MSLELFAERVFGDKDKGRGMAEQPQSVAFGAPADRFAKGQGGHCDRP